MLLLCVIELILATPGLDLLGTNQLVSEQSRNRMRREPLGFVAIGAADFNRSVRAPFNQALTPLQRPLRIAQSWGLYAGGPKQLDRMEILIDDTLVYRSKDPDHTWLASVLTYRRIRPIVAYTCYGKSRNDAHLIAYVVDRARRDFPDASEIVVQCTEVPFPGLAKPEVSQHYIAAAPDWQVLH